MRLPLPSLFYIPRVEMTHSNKKKKVRKIRRKVKEEKTVENVTGNSKKFDFNCPIKKEDLLGLFFRYIYFLFLDFRNIEN